MIHQAGAKLFYLPSYSPDLNSTEKLWAKVKAFLRKRRALTPEALQRRDRLRLPVLHLLIAETGLHKLTALSIVGRLENGLDTRIGASLYDDGIDLSGGETQKIVATRTLLDNADIWIFDEPVAAMDPSSEYSFFNTVLEEDDKSKTMIFVSHRLKIASKMNRIIYLENGKIVGIGTHQQLMTGCEKYRRYYVSWLLMEND